MLFYLFHFVISFISTVLFSIIFTHVLSNFMVKSKEKRTENLTI